MRVFVSVDMEGIAGIATRNQVMRGTDDFPAARLLMTAEANAAVAGAFDGGAEAVVVNDSHGDMANLLPDRMDRRAELTIGSPKIPGSMVQGLDDTFGVALFVGYHAAAGEADGVLAHTYHGGALYAVRLNGEAMSETDLNARAAATFGVPLGLVTGDDKICAAVDKAFPGVRTVAVKRGLGQMVTTSIHPEEAVERIRAAAAEAVAGAAGLRCLPPLGHYELEVDFATLRHAELAALVPGTARVAGRTVSFAAADFLTVFRCLLLWTHVAAAVQ